MSEPRPPESPIETLKRASRHLRGSLAQELESPEPGFLPDSQQLIKLHGLYQQKNRDQDHDQTPVLMVRGRIPGGRLSRSQYLVWNDLADQFGDGTLRITTRQSVELHGIPKAHLRDVLQRIHQIHLTAQNACGDVVRNITQAPNPWGRLDLAALNDVAERLSDHFLARSNAYAEVWLNGKPVDPATETEPFLGSTYLPRKFKIALTIAGENLVDLYSNDLAFVATTSQGKIDGFFCFAGGGQGTTPSDPRTFPRLADLLGWLPADQILPVAEAVLTLQRDFGDRSNRRQARLKYLIAHKGLPWFKREVQSRWGSAFRRRKLPPWRTTPILGWIQSTDGTWAYGLHTLSGRIPAGDFKNLLRDLVQEYDLAVQLTPDQDLILQGIRSKDRPAVEQRLHPTAPSPLRQRALACVALPYCSLAITESERVFPRVLELTETALERHGLTQQAPVFRMTGCANGCARPYSAELALVGQGKGKYALHTGGSPEGDRLAFPIAQKVTLDQLPALLDRLFAFWKAEGFPREPLGDFAFRIGPTALGALFESLP